MTQLPAMLRDEPEQLDDQLWPGLCGFAQRLAQVVQGLPASSPVLLGGDWGSGKTTLLCALRRAIDSSEPRRPTVWFDAWRYEAEPALLPALMRAVWEAAPESYRNRKESLALFASLWRLAVVVGTRVLPALLEGAGAPVIGKVVEGLSASDLSDDLDAVGGVAAAPPADATRLLWERFDHLVREAWSGAAPIILIDDLDRCNPDGAVALLDGIRTLVTGACELRCNFVVALDRGILAGAVTRKFAGISGYDGNRYLEKIFPVSFAVPTPYEEAAADLVGKLLGSSAEGIEQDHRGALSLALKSPLFANPRLMKRCINRFRLITFFESTLPSAAPPDDSSSRAQRDQALAKWIAATERWPMLRSMMLRHDDEQWRTLGEALLAPDKPAPGPEAAAILAEHGALLWLRKDMFGRDGRVPLYREAEARLRRWGL